MFARYTCLAGFAVLLFVSAAAAQSAPSAERVVRVSGALPGAAGRQAPVRFAIYDASDGGTLLWQETQTVSVDAGGQYAAFLGATSRDGLPVDLFAGGAPRWLAVETGDGSTPPRTLLAAVPYAVSAATATNASALAGRPATDFQLTPAAQRRNAAQVTPGAATLAAPSVSNGAANFLGKFATSVDLVSSQLYDTGTNVGLGTTSPLDKFHVQFTNTAGSMTGVAVQNLGNSATSYSGMLFYDHTGALRQFQGYNNATGEYRINNISPTPSINFMTGGTSRFFINAAGAVGIGQTAPQARLDVRQNGFPVGLRVQSTTSDALLDLDAAANAFPALRLRRDGALRWEVGNNLSDDLYVSDYSLSSGYALLIKGSTGNVGIGTSTPDVRLDVAGSDLVSNSATSAYFTPGSSALVTGYTGSFFGVTIRASNYIIGGGIGAISDARIKQVRGRSNAAADLATLNAIQITDYTYKDTVAKGTTPQKKVVAQQVEQVFPQAVSQMTDVVPDIFTTAPIRDGWIMLTTDLTRGERVRLVTRAGEQAVHEVVAVEPGRFRTDLIAPADGEVFVYGREVKDFRVVDYDAIAMLNVSATQELARRNATLEARIAALEAALKALAASAPQR